MATFKKYFVCALLFAGQLAWGGDYYVDAQAAGGGNGTQAAPWQRISQAIDQLHPGDTVYIRGGASAPRVYNESIALSRPGTIAQPIVVMAYPGELVEIRSTGSHVIDMNQDYYIIDGLILDHQMRSGDAISWDADNSVLRNCVLRNGASDGVDMNDANNNVIENCRIYNFNTGNQYDAHGIVLETGDNNIFRNNEIFDCKGDCIQIIHGSARWTEISGNDLYTTNPGFVSENAIDIKSTFGVKVLANRMHGFRRSADSDGVALVAHHDSDSLIIRENIIYDCNGGLRITEASRGIPDDVLIERNLIHSIVDEGNYSVDGYGIQFDGANNVTMHNNTFANIPGPLFWLASGGATDIYIGNNLFVNTAGLHGSQSNLNGTISIAYNGWFNSQERLSGDSNPLIGSDPQFADPGSFDFHLQAGSPCIDAGDPSYGSGFPGGRIDIGCFEYDGATGIGAGGTISRSFALVQNYPNPFNPGTTIQYTLAGAADVHLAVYNLLGQTVRTLVAQRQPGGSYTVYWDGNNDSGQEMPSAIYFYNIKVNENSATRRMILAR